MDDLITEMHAVMRALRDLLSSDPDMPSHQETYDEGERALTKAQQLLRTRGMLPPDLDD